MGGENSEQGAREDEKKSRGKSSRSALSRSHRRSSSSSRSSRHSRRSHRSHHSHRSRRKKRRKYLIYSGVLSFGILLVLFVFSVVMGIGPGRPIYRHRLLAQARAAASEGRTATAMTRYQEVWRSGLVGAPLAVEALRCLESSNVDFPAASLKEPALFFAGYLLRQSDLKPQEAELAIQALYKCGLYDEIVSRYYGKEERIPALAFPAYMKALFRMKMYGRFQNLLGRFDPLLRRLAKTGGEDPELAVYRRALTLLEPGAYPGAMTGFARLCGAKATEETAYRTLLQISDRIGDRPAAALALARLVKDGKARYGDYLKFWWLLSWLGNQGEAVELALAHPQTPKTAGERAAFCRILFEAGEYARMSELLGDWLGNASAPDPGMSILYALALAKRNVEGLMTFGRTLAHKPGTPPALLPVAYVTSTRAEDVVGELRVSSELMTPLLELSKRSPEVGLDFALLLEIQGFAKQAFQWVTEIASETDVGPRFYRGMARLARMAKDEHYYCLAARKGYEMAPWRVDMETAYLDSLLLTGEAPERAAELANELSQVQAQDDVVELLYAWALLQAGRVEESKAALKMVRPDQLDAARRVDLRLVQLELAWRSGDKQAARRILAKGFPREALFPSQRRRLDSIAEKLSENL